MTTLLGSAYLHSGLDVCQSAGIMYVLIILYFALLGLKVPLKYSYGSWFVEFHLLEGPQSVPQSVGVRAHDE